MTAPTVDFPRRHARRATLVDPGPAAALSGSPRAGVVRFSAAMAATVAALLLPWLGLNLSASPSAWDLTFSLASVPVVGHVSYGLVVLVLGGCALVSFVQAGWRPTWATRAVGWSFLVLPLVFVVTTRIAGDATLFRLQYDASQSGIIDSQFLTNANSPAPTQFLGIGFDGKTLVLLYALRMGWYLLAVAGCLLVGRVSRPVSLAERASCLAAAVAAVVVAVGVVLAVVAQGEVNDGIQAVATGRPQAATALLSEALRRNPQTAYESGVEQALGQAQANEGEDTPLAQYAEAVRPQGRDITLLEQARLFAGAAAGLAPDSPAYQVVRADLVQFLCSATIAAKNPDVLSLASASLRSPALSFSEGHYYYEAGASALAVGKLGQTLDETANGELRSLALTYLALSWQRLGHEATFRQDIVAAVRADALNENVFAREIAAGLYVPGTP
ncbi:MAG TPA: hypothetical protein VMB72_11225 [Acidimicrobiales bacterium]|nr:hypothetical protein [Acidimicrobiales bacterium]